MTIKMHRQAILKALQGQTDQLRDTSMARLDWAGTGTILQLFESTSGKDRATFIDAIGQIIEDHPLSGPAIAELIHIASSLDLAQVEPQVRKLQTQRFAADADVSKAITNFLALRSLSAVTEAPFSGTAHAANGTSGRRNTVPTSPAAHQKSRQDARAPEGSQKLAGG